MKNKNTRPLSKLCILSSGKEKIYEGPQCTKGVHEDPDEIFDIARGQKPELPKRSTENKYTIRPYWIVVAILSYILLHLTWIVLVT